MIITCDKCHTRFSLDDALIKATGTKVRCKQCEHVFDVYPSGGPAFGDKADEEITGLEMENKRLPSFSAEKASGKSAEGKSEGIDFDFEFEESDEDSKDGDLDFELEMESETRTAGKELELDLELDDEEFKLELDEPSDEESKGAFTSKSDDEEEMFDLDLDLAPVAAGSAETRAAFAEEEIDISEIEKILDMDAESPEPETGDEHQDQDLDLELELELEEEENAEFATASKQEEADEDGFDINLAFAGEPEADLKPRAPVESKEVPVQAVSEEKDSGIEPEADATVLAERPQSKPFDIGAIAAPKVPEEAEEPEEPAYSIGSYQPETKKRSRSLVYLLLILILILAGAGYGVFWLMQHKGIQVPAVSNLFKFSAVDEKGSLKISTTEISGRFVNSLQQGRMFIIAGKARNDYAEARSAIRITAKLYAPGKVLVASQNVFCGNSLSEAELESLDIGTILSRLQNPSGDRQSGERIEPGKDIPFMAVFSNLPDNLDEYTVEVEGSSPVKP